jgi:hypothetical protein
MTSFGGLVIFQRLFQNLDLDQHLKDCFARLDRSKDRFYKYHKVILCLVVHLVLGYRRLREMDYFRDDPLVRQVLGLHHLPSVPTVSRMLGEIDEKSLGNMREMIRHLCLSRLLDEGVKRITLDLDGSVQSTTRHAEGSAAGYNKKKKGARSYYPLFATIAQTGQIFDFHHRSGNVHDSNGAVEFLRFCVEEIRKVLPRVQIEIRGDSAFFSDKMVSAAKALDLEFTFTVPFERLAELKELIERRRHWSRTRGAKGKVHHFEVRWKPKSWERKNRILCVRTEERKQRKGPLQLDLFEPVEEDYKYKAIITNKTCKAAHVVQFHEGRGSQEKIFGEAKSHAQMDYIPAKRRVANQAFLLSSVLTHNLGRELQMRAAPPTRGLTPARATKWIFESLDSIRRKIIQRAGRLTRPQGRQTLTLGTNRKVEQEIRRFLNAS